MTAFFDITKAIIDRMQANWATTPIIYDDENYEPDGTTAFVAFFVHHTNSDQASLSNDPIIRFGGTIEASIYTASAQGIGLGLQHADSIAAIFRRQRFSNVLCYAPRIAPQGQRQKKFTNGVYIHTPLFCRFEYDKHFG